MAPRQILSQNTRLHQVNLTIVAGYNSGGFDLDGTQNGAMHIQVPAGSTVVVSFVNKSELPNSLAVVQAASATTPAFAGAGTPADALTTGIAPGQHRVFRFVASVPGVYRLTSLVPGHEESGMWATFEVVPAGSASVRL